MRSGVLTTCEVGGRSIAADAPPALQEPQVLVALGGRIADLLGAERTFRAGAALFVTASALCGPATGEAGLSPPVACRASAPR